MGSAKHLWWWVPALLVGLVTATLSLNRAAHVRLSDLGVYVGAANGLRDGASLYDFVVRDAPFTYPPFAGLLFLPLTELSLPVLRLGWTTATLAVVGLLAVVLAHAALHFRGVEPRRATSELPAGAAAGSRFAGLLAPGLALVLMVSAPVSSNIRYGQVSLFLAALVAVDVLLLRGRPANGILIGIAAAVKLTPLIFVPMLWLAGERRAAIRAAATFAACGLVAAIALPEDSWRFWTAEVSHVSRLGHITGVGNQSLNGALMRLEISTPIRTALVLAIAGVLAALALRNAAALARRGHWIAALAVTGAASIILSPVSWTHHQVWLLLALFLPFPTRRARLAWAATVIAIMLIPITALPGPVFGNMRLLLAAAIIFATSQPLSPVRPQLPEAAQPQQRTVPAKVSPLMRP